MKIGFVLDDTLDTPDGVQQYVLTLGSWMTGQGHEVRYLVGQTERTDTPNVHSLSRNVKVKFNGNRMSMPLPVSKRKLHDMLARERYDVLHVQVPYSPMMAHRLLLAAPPQTALVGTFHIAPHTALVRYATRGLAVWTRSSSRKFDKLFSVSAAAHELAQQTFRMDSEVLPNVVDVDRFADGRPFERYADDVPTIMFLGRLVPRKGCRLLLEAAAKLQSLDPSLKFRVVVCGRGPLETELKQYCTATGLGDIVEFTGFVSEEDKPRYLASADVAVFPSSGGESFGIVLIEAMAAGSPVVLAADNPGYKTVLGPYPDLLFPVGDTAALADKLQGYLSDAVQKQKALAWQAEYVSRFDTAVVGTKLLETYATAHQNRTGPPDNSMRQ